MFLWSCQFGEAVESQQEWEDEANLQTLNFLPCKKQVYASFILMATAKSPCQEVLPI